MAAAACRAARGSAQLRSAGPEHDFPQRIISDGREDGALMAAIEGTRDGRTARTSWRMLRTDCKR